MTLFPPVTLGADAALAAALCAVDPAGLGGVALRAPSGPLRDAWLALLKRMEGGQLRLISRDLPAPSPLAAAILNARPYAFLDDAPLEERRTQAVINRRWSDPQSTDDLGALDADAINAVREEAWPTPSTVDEMHEALMSLACIACIDFIIESIWVGDGEAGIPGAAFAAPGGWCAAWSSALGPAAQPARISDAPMAVRTSFMGTSN